MTSPTRSALPVLVVALAAVACDAPLARLEQVTAPRVLAARVEVDGAPERATPAAGEAFTVRWLVVDERGDLAVGHRAELCVADATAVGAVGCAADPLPAVLTQPGAAPSSAWTAPADADRSLLSALFCAEAAIDADGDRCADGAPPLAASLVIDHAPDAAHQNPTLAPDALTLDGQPWADGDCPTLAPGATAAVAWQGAAATREAGEALQLTLFVTGGTVEQPLVVIERGTTADPLVARFAWALPGRAPTAPLHAWLVVRDGRGGSDFAHRALCPAP